MTVKEYNRGFLPRIQRAREFVSLFESAINHMDDARVDKEEVRKQFRIRSWSEETKQTILIALAHYKKYEGLDKIESMEIIHCPTCGHHINIQSNGTTGYCPICDKEVPDMEKRTICVKPSCFAPGFEMIIPIPSDRDDEEYIDELLDGILSPEFRYNVEWDFVDGLS